MNMRNAIKCIAATAVITVPIMVATAVSGIGPAANFFLSIVLSFLAMQVAMARWPIFG